MGYPKRNLWLLLVRSSRKAFLKIMTGYSFPLFSSLLKKVGRRKGEFKSCLSSRSFTKLSLLIFFISPVCSLFFPSRSLSVDRAEMHDLWLRFLLIHSPLLLPSFVRREEKRGKEDQSHAFCIILTVVITLLFGIENYREQYRKKP